jgi:CHASE2 domain-containing sensor protein
MSELLEPITTNTKKQGACMRRLDFWNSDWFFGIIVALLVLIVATGGLFHRLERNPYDLGVPASSRTPPDTIAVVAIDDQSIAAIGRWPWSRGVPIGTDTALRMHTCSYPASESRPPFTVKSFFDVCTRNIPPAEYADKIVLIGATATGRTEIPATPVPAAMPLRPCVASCTPSTSPQAAAANV